MALYNRLRQSPTHGSDIIKESAEHLLLLLTHFVQNFPGPKGIDVFSSQISEADDQYEEREQTVYYVYNDFVILSITQVEGEGMCSSSSS